MRYLRLTRVVLFLLLIAWMSVIFVMSAQPASESSQLSGGIVAKFISIFFEKFESLSKNQQESITYILTLIVRKSAHFLEYFILGVISGAMSLTYSKYNFKAKTLFVLLFCILYAISDEPERFSLRLALLFE